MFIMAKELAASRTILEEPVAEVNPTVVEDLSADRWVVMGGSGQMGRQVALDLVQDGARVIATSRRGQPKEIKPIVNVTWEKTPDTESAEVWEELFIKQFKALGPDKKLYVANMINNMDDYEVNVRVAEAAAKGLANAAQKEKRDYYMVFVSTMAAGETAEGKPRIPNDAYASSKTRSEEVVRKYLGKDHVTLFRMGYGLDQPTKNGRTLEIDNEHAYAPDQMATLCVQPVIGNGKQVLQPVALKDAIRGIINAPKHPSIHCIEAVGPEAISQAEFYKFFRETLQNKPFNPIYLPPDEMNTLAEQFPYGHFSPFAVKYLKNGGYTLDHKPLEEVVGRPLLKLEQIYKIKDGETYVMAKPPIMEHAKRVIKKCWEEPKTVVTAAKTLPKIASYAYNNRNNDKKGEDL